MLRSEVVTVTFVALFVVGGRCRCRHRHRRPRSTGLWDASGAAGEGRGSLHEEKKHGVVSLVGERGFVAAVVVVGGCGSWLRLCGGGVDFAYRAALCCGSAKVVGGSLQLRRSATEV